jgi:acetolactate synthase I/II/III large subunit
MTRTMTGARMVVQALKDQGVDTVFGYPGGAVLPIYDEIFQQNEIRHILVRHEQGAVHMAEGYARSTGKPGVVLVTSGPGATNAVTGLTDALMDSIPLVVLTGQVPTFMIGTDGFQEADTVGITRPCTKMNWLVKETERLSDVIHQAFHVATQGRPGPVLIDIPKDVQFATGTYVPPAKARVQHYQPKRKGDIDQITRLVELMETAERPILYTGGGVINSGPAASQLLRELVDATGFPVTSTLMGLGAYPASGKQLAGHAGDAWPLRGQPRDARLRPDDQHRRALRRPDHRADRRLQPALAQGAHRYRPVVHQQGDPGGRADRGRRGPCAGRPAEGLEGARSQGQFRRPVEVVGEDRRMAKGGLSALQAVRGKTIKPQYALERLEALTKDHPKRYICTEVGQHQMWAAQYLGFDEPNRWMTSGGLGTMGYGLPASIGVQVAHPDALVINVAGEASWLMNMQEMGTAVQFRTPVKQFILNNERLGMVRQWQELLHGERYSHSWSESLPDFVKLAEAFGCKGIKCSDPKDLDDAIRDMLAYDGPVIFDCLVEKHENCFPMIPSGKPHNEMLLGEADTKGVIGAKGAVLV